MPPRPGGSAVPSLGSHLAVARRVADRLRQEAIDADRGAYYLGATAPDIRAITRRDRRETHFYELDDFQPQDSIGRMARAYPELGAPVALPRPTPAFLAGYVTHLVMDERYIEGIYRSEFGERSPRAGDPRRDVLDRALQFEMDRREREDAAAMAEICGALAEQEGGPSVPFLAESELSRWRGVVAEIAAQPPTYERFPRMLRIHLGRAGLDDAAIEEQLTRGPGLAAEAIAVVTEERMRAFWAEAADACVERLASYFAWEGAA